MKCPICSSPDHQLVFTAKCGRFDGSVLYKNLNIVKCNDCNHFFNQVSTKDYKNLAVYYETEYAEANAHSITEGDLPGSSNEKTLARYNSLYDVLKNYINEDSQILDVGCALGGFLNFLETKGHVYLKGVDTNRVYLEWSNRNIGYADATSLPFEKNTFDCVIMDQVLEHLVNPGKAIREAYRVLTREGTLCIAVPNIGRYCATEIVPGFWYTMREHLQHFSISSLQELCYRHKFDLQEFRMVETPMTGNVVLPNLIAVFKKIDQTTGVRFMSPSQFDKLKSLFEKVAKKKTPVYCWGIGREFFFVYETLGLKHCNIVGLIDSNPYKQTLTVDGRSIFGPEILREKTPDAVIYISAYSHWDSIQKQINEMGLK